MTAYDPSAVLDAILSAIQANLVIFIVVVVVNLVMNVVGILLGVKAVKGENQEFGSILLSWLITVLLGWIPCLGCFLVSWLLGKRHEVGFWKGFLIYLLASLIAYAVSLVLTYTLGAALFDALYAAIEGLLPATMPI